MMLWLVVSTFLTSALAIGPNPYLARSPWPICHHDTYNSDNSAGLGPQVVDPGYLKKQLLRHTGRPLQDADPITLVMTEDKGHIWGSSFGDIILISIDKNEMKLVDALSHGINLEFHGAYSLVMKDGTYVTTSRNNVSAYANVNGKIHKLRDWVLPKPLATDEHLVGMSMSYDGWLVIATNYGRVAAVSQDFTQTSNIYQIPGLDKVEIPHKFISNSFSVDDENGIYIATSLSVSRLQWVLATKTIELTWTTDYSAGNDPWYTARLGPGIGSSPTVMINGTHSRFIVNTDGETPMNILFHDSRSGRLDASAVVDFGKPGQNTTSEQSVVVKGNKAVVVNNWMADDEILVRTCAEATKKSNLTQLLAHTCVPLLGGYALGVQQFAIDFPSLTVTSNWVNANVSCATSIPVVSGKDGAEVLYCLGKTKHGYTVEALDWNTGESLWQYLLGREVYNVFYADTEIGPYEDIIVGTLGGVLRLKL